LKAGNGGDGWNETGWGSGGVEDDDLDDLEGLDDLDLSDDDAKPAPNKKAVGSKSRPPTQGMQLFGTSEGAKQSVIERRDEAAKKEGGAKKMSASKLPSASGGSSGGDDWEW
jgi:hypothetical protein